MEPNKEVDPGGAVLVRLGVVADRPKGFALVMRRGDLH